MLELMAVAQVAQFRNNAVPMVNILANRTAFRPFLYFRHEDVMITTPKAVPFRRDANTIDIQGLLLLFLVLRLHKTSSITFKMDIIKRTVKTGWKEALHNGEDDYSGSEIKLTPTRSEPADVDAEYFMQDTSEDDSTDDELEPPQKKKRCQ